MKNKILGLLLVIGLLSIYPTWRYFTNAKIFAKALVTHSSALGEWTHGSISSGIDGKITIRNLNFTPENYTQGYTIDSITIDTDPLFILKNSAAKLDYMLPETLSISVNTAILNGESNDITGMLGDKSMWMLMAGFAGSFGCKNDSYTSFDTGSWQSILDENQIFNVDLFYSRQTDGSLDVDLILDAENLFSTTWSSNLVSSYNEQQISISELIAEKLFYNYLDNGYNQKRNDVCKQNYNSSFAAYRLNSAEHVQKYFRTYYEKELPPVLINLYQRLLTPDVEYNAIITLNERKYIGDIYRTHQNKMYENSLVELAATDNTYLPITFQKIDFTTIDTNVLIKESIKRQLQNEKIEAQALKPKENKYKPVIHKIGGTKTKKLPINKLTSAINKRLRIKTKRGRPVSGYLRAVKQGMVTIESKYKKGVAILTLAIDEIASIEIIK